jgi:hypothetical protein
MIMAGRRKVAVAVEMTMETACKPEGGLNDYGDGLLIDCQSGKVAVAVEQRLGDGLAVAGPVRAR